LLRVMTPVYAAAVPAEPAMFGTVAGDVMVRVEQIHRELRDEATAYLTKIAGGIRTRTGATVETRVVVEEQPAEAILASATGSIDMIALETHGRSGLSRLLLGSVADTIVRGSRLPILVHKPAS
jgi:nucleotide-binding universal stress UspA family protein